ncbi:E3 ubiquitin-protein ligase TRIM41 [Ornithorhynchus anatinus]|uniref:Tripartite motif containing 41 n=1 Tax=Ornithorhynchus anatinus TaxID=9258 RepID=A0A6I8NJW3_ORNAN|nr:E3 ubiquitin-protein ligase TRIM41 [Ornithorhynchus anatinus]
MAGPVSLPNPVQTLQEEAVCAICLDYFTDPVSIGCGHNFCRACVTQLWGREEDEEDVREEEEGEEEEAAAAASVAAVVTGDEDPSDWDTPMREEEYEGDMEDEEEEEADDEEFWNAGFDGDMWEDMDYVWEEDDENFDYFLEEEEEEEDEDEDDDEALEEEEEEELEDGPSSSASSQPRRRFTCPQCRKTFPHRSFRPNLQLANMVQIIKQMHPNPRRGSRGGGGLDQGFCPKHQEALKLFCEVDKEAICVVCRESRSHKQHSVVPLEEVVQEFKVKLQSQLEPLKKQLDAVLKLKAKEEKKITELKGQMKLELQTVTSKFSRLARFLAEEQAGLEQWLRGRHEAQLDRAGATMTQLGERASHLNCLIAEVQECSQQGTLRLLKDIKETFDRCEEVQLQPLDISSSVLCHPHNQDFMMDVIVRKMSRTFCQAGRADLTLDPDTAHPALSLSPDCRAVRLGDRRPAPPGRPKRLPADLAVLGAQGFRSGRHYWEVEVSGRRGWAVGVAREGAWPPEGSGASRGGGGASRDGTAGACALPSAAAAAASTTGRPRHRPHHHHHHRHRPGSLPPGATVAAAALQPDIWILSSNGKRYQAQSSSEQVLLSPGDKLRRLGLYLDCEGGHLGFYNADTLAHVYTFSNAFLGDRVFPYFRVLSKGTRIRLCP